MRYSAEHHAHRLALIAALVLCSPAVSADDACVTCHAQQRDPRLREPVERVRESVHAGSTGGCVGCHGGRPGEPTIQAHDAAAGFLARPAASAITERCGACHADARFVRRFRADLPTDQLALFRADAHGRLVAGASGTAPSCTSCHGSHEIRASSIAASRTSQRHIHETCGGCHSDPARMGSSRMATNQVAQWLGSVHGRAVVEHSNPRAPTCVGCHGSHGEFREAGGAGGQCRTCHEAEAAAFDRSPHAAPYRRLGFSGCVACHGSHDVREASSALGTAGGIGVCRQCHAEGQRSFDVARRIAGETEQAVRELSSAQVVLRELAEHGLRSPAALASLEQAQRAEVQLHVAVHSLDETVAHAAATAVREPAIRARRLARETTARNARQSRSTLPAIGLLAVFVVLAMIKIRRLDRARRNR